MDTDWLRAHGNGKNNIVFCTTWLRPQSSNNLHLAHQVSWFYRQIMTTVIGTEVEFKAVCLYDLLVWIWLHIPQAGGLKRSSLSVALQQRDLYTWVLRTCDMLTQLWFRRRVLDGRHTAPQWTCTCEIVGRCSVWVQSLWQLVNSLLYLIPGCNAKSCCCQMPMFVLIYCLKGVFCFLIKNFHI